MGAHAITSLDRPDRGGVLNHSDPVTSSLADPFTLVSLAWGTAKCNDDSHRDYQKTSPVTAVCP